MNTIETHAITSADGTGIAYSVVGNGPALVLVDGALCSRAFGPLSTLASQLAGSFTVFTYDRRGRNESGDVGSYAPARESEDLAAIVAAAGGSAFVYGVSSGAVLVSRSAAKIEGILGVAVYEAPVMVDGDGIPDDYGSRLKALIAKGLNEGALDLFNTEVIGIPAEYLAPTKANPAWPLMVSGAATLAYDSAIMGDSQSGRGLDADLVESLSSISVPILVLDGGASPSMMRTGADAITSHLHDRAERRTLPRQTHEADPSILSPVLVEFFGRRATAMGMVTAQLFMSLEGVVEAPEKSHFPVLDDEITHAVSTHFARADTRLLGRVTYGIFVDTWPHRLDEEFLAQRINSMPKLVATSGTDELTWRNSSIANPYLRAQLTHLSADGDATIAVAGSITLVRWLIRERLLDELELLIHPIGLGNGEKLFAPGLGLDSIKFEPAQSTAFSTGVLDLMYRRSAADTDQTANNRRN